MRILKLVLILVITFAGIITANAPSIQTLTESPTQNIANTESTIRFYVRSTPEGATTARTTIRSHPYWTPKIEGAPAIPSTSTNTIEIAASSSSKGPKTALAEQVVRMYNGELNYYHAPFFGPNQTFTPDDTDYNLAYPHIEIPERKAGPAPDQETSESTAPPTTALEARSPRFSFHRHSFTGSTVPLPLTSSPVSAASLSPAHGAAINTERATSMSTSAAMSATVTKASHGAVRDIRSFDSSTIDVDAESNVPVCLFTIATIRMVSSTLGSVSCDENESLNNAADRGIPEFNYMVLLVQLAFVGFLFVVAG